MLLSGSGSGATSSSGGSAGGLFNPPAPGFFVSGESCVVMNEPDFSETWSEVREGFDVGRATFDADAFYGAKESRTKDGGQLPKLTTNHLGDRRSERIHSG